MTFLLNMQHFNPYMNFVKGTTTLRPHIKTGKSLCEILSNKEGRAFSSGTYADNLHETAKNAQIKLVSDKIENLFPQIYNNIKNKCDEEAAKGKFRAIIATASHMGNASKFIQHGYFLNTDGITKLNSDLAIFSANTKLRDVSGIHFHAEVSSYFQKNDFVKVFACWEKHIK